MQIIEDAFKELFPEKEINNYDFNIRYTKKFKPYNANVRYTKNSFNFNLSRKWKGVSKEIQAGLIQGLLLKIFRKKASTINIDLYNNFMKNLHLSVPKTRSDPLLENSFNKINEKYFFGLVEKPNLVWHDSIYRLGSYEYGSDTISISKVLENDRDLLDYVMHHEILHKKHKFKDGNGRSCHHTKEFREIERRFENYDSMEAKLKQLVRKGRKRFIFF